MQAVKSVASAEAMLNWTIEHTTQRNAFGKKLADFQNTQFVLADLYSQILQNRVFVDRCLELHVQGMMAAEMQGRVADACLQFFGALGYMRETPIGRAWIDARQARIAGGSIEIMKLIISRKILPRAK